MSRGFKWKPVPAPPKHGARRKAKRSRVGNGCAGKKKRTYEDAKTEATRILQRTPEKKRLSIYLCPLCAHYHLSRQVHDDAVATVEVNHD